MNISYSWLRSLAPTELSPPALRDLITAHCVTVDELVELRGELRDVVIGLVVEAAPHPSADRLWLTKVDAGTGALLEVVCGAPNVTAGKRYPFAGAGTTLPGGVKIERRKIRGAVSNGMLCSALELGLGDDHQGILELDTTAAPGTPLLDAVPLGDVRLVIDVPPNRPDLLSHLGVAREVAAVTRAPLHLPTGSAAVDIVRDQRAGRAGPVTVELRDPEGCPRYTGVVIRGVRVAPSPAWLVERLLAVDARPVNNIVDVTNYLMLELGQPMHAFDAAKLAGPAVIVRRARPREALTTIDGTAVVLEPSMTAIADAERARAVAGVMGGRDSEVTAETTDIFLEVATFDPASVRRTRRALGMSTDASFRFERGTDIDLPPQALRRAVELILDVAGGAVDGSAVDLYSAPRSRTAVRLRVGRVAAVLGDAVPEGEIVAMLESIGFVVRARDGQVLDLLVPSWRPDVSEEIHLIEEVARLRGYDAFPDELRPFRPGRVPDSELHLVARAMRERLVAAGLLEARPMPFVRAAGETDAVRVANPLSESEAYLRSQLLDSLALRAEYNLARMQRDVRLFEIGHAFRASRGAMPREELRAAVLVMGARRPPHWTDDTPPPDYDEWDAEGLAELMMDGVKGLAGAELRPASPPLLWEVVVDGDVRGVVRPLALDAPVWAAPAYGIEIALAIVESSFVAPPGERSGVRSSGVRSNGAQRPAAAPVRYRPIPTTPAADFDVALLVPNDLPAAQVEERMRVTAGALLERVTLLSEYRGSGVPEGFRSLAWRVTLRDPNRTLKGAEIAGRREKLLRSVEELGVRQRTT